MIIKIGSIQICKINEGLNENEKLDVKSYSHNQLHKIDMDELKLEYGINGDGTDSEISHPFGSQSNCISCSNID